MSPENNNTRTQSASATAVKWALWIFLALLPVGILGLYAFRTASHSVRESIRANNFAAAVVAADFVRDDFERGINRTSTLADSPDFIAAVRERDEEAVRNHLRSVVLPYSGLDRAFVHDVDGVLWSDFPRATESLGRSFADREWYAGVSSKWEPYVTAAYNRHAAPQVPVVAIAVPVRDQEAEVIAIVVTHHRLDSISEGLRYVRWGESGMVFLLDADGRVAGHPELDLEEEVYRDYAHLEPVRQALQGSAYTGELADPLNGESAVATFYPFKVTSRNWVLVAKWSTDEAYAPIRTMAWNIGAAGVILALAAAAVVMGLWQVSENNRRLSLKLEGRTAALQEQTMRLRNLTAQLASTEQRERKRLAALLHDDLQQLLVAANMRLNGVKRRVQDESLKQMLREVGDWIDLATASARDLTHELRPPALYEAGLTDALQWLASRMWERHHLRVEVETEAALPPLRDDLKALLFDCVRELLFNVAKHAEVERATVSIAEDGKSLHVLVEDKGRGFEVEAVAKEAHEPGFGLFSIRERLLSFGGDMTIDSRPGAGTRTTLTIPLAGAIAGAPAGEGDPELSEAQVPEDEWVGSVRQGRVRVLVVDDHAIVRQGIANLLSHDTRIEVVGEAADGIEAIRAVGEKHPNVVLMDLNMPRMNGIEATREIHRRWPETGVIGLSVQDDETTAQSMLAAGAEAFLSKTGDAGRMIATIMSITELHRSLPEPPAI